ncbi:piggyBac transposable element-derived protein 3-like [Schistocerca cancellata]|uniref:piggyBac transposable element-derived protein 3-like n=1 Tax=Schistocerca cancellata TaxID=274614 RepID=UPI00211746DD|nr:piggyBac transposable element-derived protein 3-like [Schistocerca cancellata]XP_049780399.1 piggyBac transposable element-derived protein 3-like [Schistocerca cancellata]XP_049780400.1 piggyBac transposable element-derived protein 3-like [Schistocerca cancellata]XP_049780401.1 piggyBac transposable element-derived protein 3-like [Schistocerca cancellata]XP_049780402.1 piggyBac transposable element-derived protein 3-like [Schistocerca cancellata]XP_049780403.1 piggyBac transposable element-
MDENRKTGGYFRPLSDAEIEAILYEDIPSDISEDTDIEDDDENVNNFDKAFPCNLQEADCETNSTCSDNDASESSLPFTSSPQCEYWTKRMWRDKHIETRNCEYRYSEGPMEELFQDCLTATDVFIFILKPIVEDIIFQSNLYATQKGKILNLKEHELFAFLGINLFMGYHKLPSWKHYWSACDDLGISIVKRCMSRDRYDFILSNLHLNDNTKIPERNTDKLYKIRPPLTALNKQFMSIYRGTRELSIDESMIVFKGRSSIKQYNPLKPIKRGYKLWAICDKKGYTLNFEVYQGRNETLEKDFEGYGLGERVVLKLSKPYWGQYRKLYFDIFFTSIPLLEKLKSVNTFACGTIRTNRKGLPANLPKEKCLKRGESNHRVSSLDLTVFQWRDNKVVYFASNFHGTEQSVVSRKQKDGTSMTIPCPAIVCDYNKNMGGVDHADRLRSAYGLDRRSKKWWHRLLWGAIEISFVNAYVIFSDLHGALPLLEFRRAVALGLMNEQQVPNLKKRNSGKDEITPPKRRKDNFSVPKDVRLGNRGNHFVVFSCKRGRCEMCAKNKIQSRPHSQCSTCKVYLCCNEKKNCFLQFHEVSLNM